MKTTQTQEALADIAGLTPQSLLNEAVRRAFANGATPLVLEMAMQEAIKKHLSERSEHSGHSISFSQTVRAIRAQTLLPKIPRRPVSGTVLPFVRLRGFRTTEDALARKRAQQAARNRYRFQAYPAADMPGGESLI